MKQGNQFYLEIQLIDENNEILDISSVLKVQFTIDDLIKYYDGTSEEVTYDETKKCFKIWLTENETFKFEKQIKMDASACRYLGVHKGSVGRVAKGKAKTIKGYKSKYI